MLGEAGDHLSEASISDLNKAVKKARSDPANTNSGLRSMLFDLPGAPGGDMARDMDDIANSRAGDPDQMSPQVSNRGMLYHVFFATEHTPLLSLAIAREPLEGPRLP